MNGSRGVKGYSGDHGARGRFSEAWTSDSQSKFCDDASSWYLTACPEVRKLRTSQVAVSLQLTGCSVPVCQ